MCTDPLLDAAISAKLNTELSENHRNTFNALKAHENMRGVVSAILAAKTISKESKAALRKMKKLYPGHYDGVDSTATLGNYRRAGLLLCDLIARAFDRDEMEQRMGECIFCHSLFSQSKQLQSRCEDGY